MFSPGSRILTDHFLLPDPGSGSKIFFIPYPGSYMKSGMQTFFFLASYAFRNKLLVLIIVKKIRDPEKNSSRIRIPVPRGKKHRIPDLQH
jgi:hypothetical protein